jgi:hypothetical protein
MTMPLRAEHVPVVAAAVRDFDSIKQHENRHENSDAGEVCALRIGNIKHRFKHKTHDRDEQHQADAELRHLQVFAEGFV